MSLIPSRLLLGDPPDHVQIAAVLIVRKLAAEQMEKDHAERVDVAARIHLVGMAGGLFGIMNGGVPAISPSTEI